MARTICLIRFAHSSVRQSLSLNIAPLIFKYFCLKDHTSSNDSVFLLYSKKCLQKDLYSNQNKYHTAEDGDIHLKAGADQMTNHKARH